MQHCNDYSKCGLSEPPQAMIEGEACLAFFLLLELDVGAPSCCFIYGNEGQVWENNDMGDLDKERQTMV
jgi:hypothetical protein